MEKLRLKSSLVAQWVKDQTLYCCGTRSIPGPGTSTYHKHDQKTNKKRKKKKTKTQRDNFPKSQILSLNPAPQSHAHVATNQSLVFQQEKNAIQPEAKHTGCQKKGFQQCEANALFPNKTTVNSFLNTGMW